jgi:DNA-directed RNA polymerase specialized sigma subunit
MSTTSPKAAARAQLRKVRQQIELAEARLAMLHTLRATIVRDAQRRRLSNGQIADELGVSKQRVGQIAQETAEQIRAVNG